MTGIDTLLREPAIEAVGWALLHFLWQGALVGTLAALALRALAGSAADVRYVVAATALALMATMPVVTGVQAWRSARAQLIESAPASTAVAGVVRPSAAATADALPGAVADAPVDSGAPAGPQTGRLGRWLPVIVLVWTVGVAVLALRLLGGWLWIQRMKHHGAIPADAPLQAIARRLMRSLHITRPVRLLQSSGVDVPTVIGWLRPTVLLPISALSGLSPHQLEAIVAHEFAHIRRHDYLVNLLQTLLETLLFYHPAVWWLSRRIRAEREHCCDDLAVSLCGDPVSYAQALADLEELRGPSARLVMAASGGPLLDRIRRLLAAPAPHAGRGPAWLAASAAVLVLVGTVGGVLGRPTIVAAVPGGSTEVQKHTLLEVFGGIRRAWVERAWSQVPPPRPPAPPAPPSAPVRPPDGTVTGAPPSVPSAPSVPSVPAVPSLAGLESSRSLTADGQESSGNFTWSRNGEKISVQYRGTFELNDDDTDIVKVSPGGYLKVSDGGWLRGRSVEFTADASGVVTRRFRVGSSERPFEPEGRQWLAQVLPKFVRQSGFAAKERVARFLRTGGVPAVLSEISGIEGSYGKRVYFSQLLKQAPLDADSARRVLEQAGREVESDYELASLLITASDTLVIDEAARKAYFEAARTIDSDYEARRVYTSTLRRGAVPASQLTGILEGARSIESDYEAASLLIDVVKHHAIEGPLRVPFFTALDDVQSSYEQGRVLQALLRRGEVSGDTLLGVLEQTGRIGSHYEAAQVLMAAARSHALTGAAREAYVKAADNLGDYEQNRVLAALARQERSR